jgi:hypothetical protein
MPRGLRVLPATSVLHRPPAAAVRDRAAEEAPRRARHYPASSFRRRESNAPRGRARAPPRPAPPVIPPRRTPRLPWPAGAEAAPNQSGLWAASRLQPKREPSIARPRRHGKAAAALPPARRCAFPCGRASGGGAYKSTTTTVLLRTWDSRARACERPTPRISCSSSLLVHGYSRLRSKRYSAAASAWRFCVQYFWDQRTEHSSDSMHALHGSGFCKGNRLLFGRPAE